MSLIVGQNSWTTIAEADIYLGNKIKTTEWFGLDNAPSEPGAESKETLLSTAYYWLKGAPELNISASASDDNVKNAQIEAAWFLYNYYDELKEREAAIYTGVEDFSLSKRSENLNKDLLQIPSFISGMLRDYGIRNTSADLLGEYDT